jgi:hypothetical protein
MPFFLLFEFLVFGSSLAMPFHILGTYNINTSAISASGISSGGYFSQQFHVAYSKTIMGVGVVAGGPYYCAKNSLYRTLSVCSVAPAFMDVDELINITRLSALIKVIDPVDEMKGARVMIIRGRRDSLVRQGVANKLYKYYSYFIDESDIATNYSLEAEHAMYTDDYGEDCLYLGKPFLNNCNFSAAYAILQHIYGDITPANSSKIVPENLLAFFQSEFFVASDTMVGMGLIGYVYVPTACHNTYQVCRLHIAFHGCWMSREEIGTIYVQHAGYNQLAEVNNIIILYPQTRISEGNRNSCWDWWGYTTAAYGNLTHARLLSC